MRKTYIWTVIAVVFCFLALIITYALVPADRVATDSPARSAEKSQ